MELIDWHGDEAVRVAGARLSAVVLPARGGRIVSLVDDRGREWLEQPVLPLTPVAELPDSFVAGEMCGWDECAPTIDACTVGSWVMPDHGDLWDQAWTVDGEWVGVKSPAGTYRLRRRIVPDGDGLRLDYEAETELPDFPFLYSAHPQFVAPPGSTIRLPDSVTELIDGEDPALPRFPVTPDFVAMDAVPPSGSRKLFVDPDTPVDRCALIHPDSTELLLRWDSTVLPYLGLWYDQSQFSRGPVIAIEPMTGFFDVCATALARGRVTHLRALHPLHCSIHLSVHPVRSTSSPWHQQP